MLWDNASVLPTGVQLSRDRQLACRHSTPTAQRTPRQTFGPFWQFYSPKAGRIIRVCGDLRYYLAVLLEADPRFETITPHPVRISARIGRRWVRADVDFCARDRAGEPHYFNAAYRDHLTGRNTSRKAQETMRAITAWAATAGTRFAVWTDTMIWRDPMLLANWAYLIRLIDSSDGVADIELGCRIVRAVHATGASTIAQIRQQFADTNAADVDATIVARVHSGELRADLSSRRFSAHTVIIP